MRVGLDYYDSITSHPKHFRELAQTILDGNGEVFIITAIAPWNREDVLRDIMQTGIQYTDLIIVTFNPDTEYDKVPKLKMEKAKELKLDFMIDDRPDVCQKMANRGITALLITPRGKYENQHNRVAADPATPRKGVGSLPDYENEW